jgi:cytochrome c oxidase cbb3-type subunit 2
MLALALASPSSDPVVRDRSVHTAAGVAEASPERGRAVYIAEGCISCHSQYVRPRGDGYFGPHRPLDRTAQPPLVGSRRQGPDLSNVGARRPVAYLRGHLVDPRAHNPGSRMPAYPHLFADQRGDDLVAYLATLGAVAPAAAATLP